MGPASEKDEDKVNRYGSDVVLATHRYGTLSILAGLDLHDGHVMAEVHPRHRSREFILLLQALDVHYPPSWVIRLVLDNHSSHISKETMAWLASRPNRFVYVYTPSTVLGLI